MKGDYINVEQLLFGYSNGHHLIESSISLNEHTKKKLEILSDLSGPNIQLGFEDYITGYPLEDENYYALSKTWYAPEMKRPGCVWTHMILIKYEDLNKIKNCNDLLEVFVKPSIECNKDIYSESINIEYHKVSNVNTSIDRLKFIEWSVYTNDEPIIIPADTSNDYLYEVYRFWSNQDTFFMKNFSFCTGVLASRIIEKKPIDFQVVPYSLLRNIARQNKQSKVVQLLPKEVKYPLWIEYMIDENRPNVMNEFNMFQGYLGDDYFSKKNFVKFSKLYIETNAINGHARLDEFLYYISDIFLDEDSKMMKSIILKQLLNGEHLQWFNYESVIDILLDLAIKLDLSDWNDESNLINEIIHVLWSYYPYKIKYIFEELANNKINLLGEQLIKEFAIRTLPEQLPEFTDMDLGLCNLMVKLENKFALCSEIWKQSLDFQLEIINCIEFDNEDVLLIKRILITIMENTSFDLCDCIYEKFGNIAIVTFLDWYYLNSQYDEQKGIWKNICKKNPSECLRWIVNSNKLKDIDLIIIIISILDPYSDEVIRIDTRFWIEIFYIANRHDLNSKYKFILAYFFLPIILLKEDLFPNDIVRFSFSIVCKKITQGSFNYMLWIKLEKILPEIPWYNNWNKCKRLNKAIEQKGYEL